MSLLPPLRRQVAQARSYLHTLGHTPAIIYVLGALVPCMTLKRDLQVLRSTPEEYVNSELGVLLFGSCLPVTGPSLKG